MANKYLRTAKMKMSAGTTKMNPPANFKCNGEVPKFWSKKAVNVRFSIVSTAAAKTSFQEMTKANIAEAVMPGKISGKTTFRNAESLVHPSVQAASSNSSGMPENNEKVIKTENGMASVVCTNDKPKVVSSRPV